MSLKYVGRGAFLPGIPARDLTDAEVEFHGGTEYLIQTGLYEAAEKKLSRAKRSDKRLDTEDNEDKGV